MSVHHSMSTSSNITPPNVVMGPSESSSSPLAAITKDKEKVSIARVLPVTPMSTGNMKAMSNMKVLAFMHVCLFFSVYVCVCVCVCV